MTDPTTVAPGTQAAEREPRRWRFRATPRPPLRVSVLATAVSMLLAFAAWGALIHLGAAATRLGYGGWPTDVVLVLLALGALYPVRPALRGVGLARRVRALNLEERLAEARTAAARSRESSWTALGLDASLLVAILVVEFLITNDLAVSRTFFDLPLISSTMPLVLSAFLVNIYIFLVAEVLVLIVGLAVAIARYTPGAAGRPLRALAIAYTDIFRGLPAIINIYLIGFGISLTGLPILKDLSAETFAIMALTLTSSAYVAEVYRAGLESIHWSQTAAARSLGLNYTQTLRFVIVPQAVRRIIPPLLNNFIALQKDTALVNVIGAMDAFNQSKIIASNHFNLSAVTTVAIIFVVITIPQARLVDRLVQRHRESRSG